VKGMFDSSLLKTVANKEYTEEQKKAISVGFCPECLPTLTDYRILHSYFSKEHNMMVLRVKCSNIAHCEWEETLPAHRTENGLENFFHS
jgi:hypothetical protein